MPFPSSPRLSRALLGLVVTGSVVAANGLLPLHDAAACGGCFAPPDPPTVVSGHRMVMSVSATQSVLWDQIQYSGNPAEFAWVLPVKPGARVEASTAAFFEVLEAQSATRIQPPFLDCGNGSTGGGFGCGDDAAGEDFGSPTADNGGGDPVTVVHQGTVGPYETVTLSTEQPGALNTWLESHGYNVDDSSQPIIDQYVTEGFDFIALRLQPGKGVSQMTPVRVVMEGGNLTLPLRMVGIGTGAQTPIVLYVVGEGRYGTSSFAEVQLDTSLLSWNFKTQESNYTTLHDDALAQNGGLSYLTTFAQGGFFANSNLFDQDTQQSTSFGQLYGSQAWKNGETAIACTLPQPFDLSGKVKNPCPPGEPWDSPACGAVAPGEIDARQLACTGATDLAVALEGMDFQQAWVTRMELSLPRTGLTDDLVLAANEDQNGVGSILQATIALEADGQCPGGVIPRVVKPGDVSGGRWSQLVAGALAAAGFALAYRRRRSFVPVAKKG